MTTSVESIRYLDVHPVLPDGSSAELKQSFDGLLAPLLLNSALAAIRVKPETTANSTIAITSATRALDNLQLSNADKGSDLLKSAGFCISCNIAAKALYRRALAHTQLKDEDQAEGDLVEASRLVPEDAAIAHELTKIRQQRKEKRDKEKKQFKKMFG